MTTLRAAPGSAEWVSYSGGGGCWHARVSMPGTGRLKIKLTTPAGRALDEKEGDRQLAREMTAVLSERVRARAGEHQKPATAPVTVEVFGEKWTSGELFREHGEIKQLMVKASAKDDAWRLRAHVYPYIGKMLVKDVTTRDCAHALARAAAAAVEKRGRPWRQSNKLQVYQVMRRLFDLAIIPGYLRTDNPVTLALRPKKDKDKLYGFIYPDEFLALLGCQEIPLARRVFYVLAVYTGLRKRSLLSCTWFGIDFKYGTITSLVNKNGVPQIFAQADATLPGLRSAMVVLERWYAHLGQPHANAVVVPDIQCSPRYAAVPETGGWCS